MIYSQILMTENETGPLFCITLPSSVELWEVYVYKERLKLDMEKGMNEWKTQQAYIGVSDVYSWHTNIFF